MNREHWKKMLPKIQAFVDGATIKNAAGTVLFGYPSFSGDQDDYIIAHPKERVPLEAEDWIKDGPWWVRGKGVSGFGTISGIGMCGVIVKDASPQGSAFTWDETVKLERRNATSDWMPCWKEKE